ncbi:actin binding protein [Anopheles sinensis]|uniref:Actin binding protein n=1 Tax=Anopheles sinensis TaxID=74873 RepID=A0A084W8D6_ANOSI|nr:actin binding protein [Anopheles sinensis]
MHFTKTQYQCNAVLQTLINLTPPLERNGLAGRAAAGGARDDDGASGMQGDSKGSTTSTEASM